MPPKVAVGTALFLAVIAILAITGIYLLFYTSQPFQPFQTTSQTTSSSTSSCSGSPPGGDCVSTYSYTFTLSVNYSGPWKLTYQGYNSLGEFNPTDVSGSYNGTGFFSTPVTISGIA
jgi:hypothetical protein